MTVEEKSLEIAAAYGRLTGRPDGWERYISIQEYAALREIAMKEIGIPPSTLPEPVKKSENTPCLIEQVSPSKKTQDKPRSHSNKISSQITGDTLVEKKCEPTGAPEAQNNESELSLFLSLGE